MSAHSRNYLVTGAAGFIGSRFVESCSRSSVSLISVDQEDYFKNREENRHLSYGQIIDLDTLESVLKNNPPQIDAIIHLGAVTDTRETDLQKLQKLNLDYSKFLWTYATQKKIPFVYASSAATYGDGKFGYDDDETLIPLLQPLNPYGDSKQKFDLWALDQEKQGNHPPIWAGFKFFNVYGFGERHKKFMSSVVLHAFDEIQKTGQVTLFKSHKEGIPDGFQKRDFISVDDVVNVLHFALAKPLKRGIYNLGTGQARPFFDLARAVFSALDRPEKVQFIDTPLAIRDKYQYFTEAKMDRLKQQGYDQPFASLEEGVHKYIQRLTQNQY